MTLPPYSKSREGEGQELGFGVRNGSHTARSRPVEASRESSERPCPATSAEEAARCASRGHSLGALLCRLYTQQYRHGVVGMVLLDGPHPNQGARFTTALTEAGWQEHKLVQPILHMASGVVPEQHPEGLDFAKSLAQVDQAQTFGDLPLVVISAGKSQVEAVPELPVQAALAFDRVWDEMQGELTKLSTRGVHLRAKRSGHYIHCDEPELVVETIHQTVRALRNGSPQE